MVDVWYYFLVRCTLHYRDNELLISSDAGVICSRAVIEGQFTDWRPILIRWFEAPFGTTLCFVHIGAGYVVEYTPVVG